MHSTTSSHCDEMQHVSFPLCLKSWGSVHTTHRRHQDPLLQKGVFTQLACNIKGICLQFAFSSCVNWVCSTDVTFSWGIPLHFRSPGWSPRWPTHHNQCIDSYLLPGARNSQCVTEMAISSIMQRKPKALERQSFPKMFFGSWWNCKRHTNTQRERIMRQHEEADEWQRCLQKH